MPKNKEEANHKERALKTVARSGSLLLVGLVISRFLGYLTRITLARFLGPGGMGIVYLAVSISGILLTVSLFGLPIAVKRYVSFYRGKEQTNKVKGVIVSSFEISLPVSLVASVLLFFFSDWIATAIFHKPILSIALKIFAVAIPFRTVLQISDTSIKAFETIRYHVYTRKVMEPLFKLLFVVVFIFSGYKVAGGAMGYTAGFVISALASLYFLRGRVFPTIKTKLEPLRQRKKLLAFSWPLMFMGLLWTLIGQIDTLMIGAMIKDAAPLGIYQAALPTSKFLNVAPAALSALFLPIISNLLSKEKNREIKDTYKTTSKWIFYVNFPLLFLFLLFPNAILSILFGRAFISGGIVLSILSVGFFINSFGRLGGDVVNLEERTKLHLLNSVVAITVDIVLNYALIPIYGILGAGIATSFTFLVYALLQITEAWYFLGVQPFDLNFLKSLLSGIASGAVLYYLTNVFFQELNVLIMVAAALLFLSLYSLILLALRGLDQEDVMILKALERKTGFKSRTLRKIIKKFI